jgi:16S rRNA (adenine1518-N6/adenine1519-N6)-dimethyltransferase
MTDIPRPRRSLGQHFLVSGTVLDRLERLCREAAASCGAILEIGPGRGALTARLLRLGLPVGAVEKDGDLVSHLRRAFPALDLVEGDARRMDLDRWSRKAGCAPLFVAGNLPYNAATEILLGVLSRPDAISAVAFMVQREVAEKLLPKGEGTRFPLAAFAAAAWEGRRALEVPPGAFRPLPRVRSTFCLFFRRTDPAVPWERLPAYRAFLEKAFAHPRKTLASWGPRGGTAGEAFRTALEAAGLSPVLRPAEVPLDGWASLFLALEDPQGTTRRSGGSAGKER